MRITKDPEVRKQEILETAMKLFAEQGISKTSMNDIAKTAGITKGLVYYYFASKEELVAEVASFIVKEVNQRLVAIVQDQGLDFYEKLAQILRLYLITMHEHYNFMEYSPASPGVYELIKNSLTEAALLYTKDFINQALEAGILKISYPEYTLKMIINGIADLYVEGVRDPQILAVLIEQSLALPKGSLKL
ncbi:MAG: TetR/AcrR family transcriptional regulator [Firmicutes bacterium]|nr:TetR/AcrR family transcriptional regulator [Bacillota bacterium]